MANIKVVKRSIFLTIIVALLLSIIVNAVLIVRVDKYRYKIGSEAYNDLENVRIIHESNLQVVTKAIDEGSIDNVGILKLYKNYSDLTESIAQLWNEYIYYQEDSNIIVSRKNVDTSMITVNDINSKLEDFFNNILELEMKTQNEKVELTGNMLDNFEEIYDLENKKINYYNEFCNHELNCLEQDKKKDLIIKKHYWIDIIDGYNEINSRYEDYEFKIS